MTAKDRKSDVSYLNKLVDQYNNTYITLLIKILLMMLIFLQIKKIETNSEAPKFKVMKGHSY